MARVTFRDFSRGLYLQGDRDGIPRNALRQARGIAPLREQHIKSRWGAPRIAQLTENARSIHHFAEKTLIQIGNDLGILVGNAYGSILPFQFLGGARLKTARATPTTRTSFDAFPTTTDHLFLAAGGLDRTGRIAGAFGARKLDSLMANTQWGIDPPKTPLQIHALAAAVIPIAKCEITDGWGEVQVVAGTLNPVVTGGTGFDFNNRQEGAASLIITAFKNLTYATVLPLSPAFDASQLTGGPQSSDEDWIQFWVFIEDPANVASLDLLFDVTSEIDLPLNPANAFSLNKLRDNYSFHFLPADISGVTTDLTGSGDHPALETLKGGTTGLTHDILAGKSVFSKGVLDSIHSLVTDPSSVLETLFGKGGPNPYKVLSRNIGAEISLATARQLNTDMGTTRLPAEANAWKLMRVPKASFHAAGKAVDASLWNQIRRVYFSLTATGAGTGATTTGAARIRIDQLALNIGVGMMGDYSYAYTYKNSRTGTRSNPNVLPDSLPMIKGIKRQATRIFGLQAPRDPQVDLIEVWRTIGNGNIWFKAEDIPQENFPHVEANGHIDLVADFPGMQTGGLRTAFTNPDGSPRITQYLQDEVLTFDNIAIPREVSDVAGPHLARLFFLVHKIGSRGLCYYTGPGRLESTQGFLICTSDDDPLVRVVLWNGQVYTFSNAKCFEIAGVEQPITTEIYGVPGTQWLHTIVPTPGGIIYLAKDGLRRFTGNSSELLASEATLSLFLGESVDLGATGGTVGPFNSVEDTVGEFYNGEYWISNGTTMLAVNPETKVWRDVGVRASALLADPEIRRLYLSANSALYAWETPDVFTDGGVAIPFIVELPGTVLENQSGTTKFVQRIYIDCNTNGQSLNIIARTIQHGDVSLGTITTDGRQLLEVPLLITGDVLSIELSGDLTNRVELFGCAYDYHPTVGSDGSDT